MQNLLVINFTKRFDLNQSFYEKRPRKKTFDWIIFTCNWLTYKYHRKGLTQIEFYNNYFEFLFHIEKLRNIADKDLLKHYKDLKHNLKYSSSKDIDFMDLYELVNFRFITKKETTSLEAFAVIKIV